jgi:hypothetical protein
VREPPTQLARGLAAGRFVVSVEMPLPRDIAPDKVVAEAVRSAAPA